jgi:hypothetical protein
VPKLPAPAGQPPEEKLASLGCTQASSGPSDWLCPNAAGFKECVTAVRSRNGAFLMCIQRDISARYATSGRAVDFLQEKNCSLDGSGPLSFACAGTGGLSLCQQFGKGGMGVDCKPLTINLLPRQPTIQFRPLPRQPLAQKRKRPARTPAVSMGLRRAFSI